MQRLPFNTVGLSSRMPFKTHGLSLGGSKRSYWHWKTSEGLSERDDPDRELRIEDETSRHLYSGMPPGLLANSGLFEDMNKRDRTKRGLGVKGSSG